MSAAAFAVDDVAGSVRSLLVEFGLQVDPRFAGECRDLLSNAAYRMRYGRADGLTIDELAEMMLDRRIVAEPVTERDVLDILGSLAPRECRIAGESAVTPSRDRVDEPKLSLRSDPGNGWDPLRCR